MKKALIIFDKEDFEKILGMKTYGLVGFTNDPDSVGIIIEHENGTVEEPYPQKGLIF